MRTLANGNRRVVWCATLADYRNPTVAEITAGKDITCYIVKGTLTLGPTDSDTTDESSMCDTAKGAAITYSNYEGSFTAFRDFTNLGQPTAAVDLVVVLGDKPHGYLLDLQGKPVKSTTVAANDEVWVYGGQLDTPKTDANDGNFKVTYKLVPSGELAAPTKVKA